MTWEQCMKFRFSVSTVKVSWNNQPHSLPCIFPIAVFTLQQSGAIVAEITHTLGLWARRHLTLYRKSLEKVSQSAKSSAYDGEYLRNLLKPSANHTGYYGRISTKMLQVRTNLYNGHGGSELDKVNALLFTLLTDPPHPFRKKVICVHTLLQKCSLWVHHRMRRRQDSLTFSPLILKSLMALNLG